MNHAMFCLHAHHSKHECGIMWAGNDKEAFTYVRFSKFAKSVPNLSRPCVYLSRGHLTLTSLQIVTWGVLVAAVETSLVCDQSHEDAPELCLAGLVAGSSGPVAESSVKCEVLNDWRVFWLLSPL